MEGRNYLNSEGTMARMHTPASPEEFGAEEEKEGKTAGGLTIYLILDAMKLRQG